MHITVTINFGTNEFMNTLPGNATEIAESILLAAGGDLTKDTCNVQILDSGAVGSMANSSLPEPITPPEWVPLPPEPEPHPDQTLPEPEPHPDQTLPEPEPHPDQTLPEPEPEPPRTRP